MNKNELTIEPLAEKEIPLFLEMIRELADYEKLSDQVKADEAAVQRALFCEKPDAYALMLRWNGEPAGYSVYFYSYSTFEGSRGLFIEDIYIRPEFRKRGIGSELFSWYRMKAGQKQCVRVEWMTLKWNTPAHGLFYKAGAKCEDDWLLFRMNCREFNQSG